MVKNLHAGQVHFLLTAWRRFPKVIQLCKKHEQKAYEYIDRRL